MKKNDIIKYLPETKSLRKEAVEKDKQGKKLVREAERARDIVEELRGVTLYEDFPVRLDSYDGGIEVSSPCDGIHRSAYLNPVGSTNKYVVTTYKNDDKGPFEGTPIQGEFAKSVALRLAKDFVVSGKKLKPTVSDENVVTTKKLKKQAVK